jgi:hypothetical protein
MKLRAQKSMIANNRGAQKKSKKLWVRKKSAKNQEARERKSATAKVQNLRPKKEREELRQRAQKRKREA